MISGNYYNKIPALYIVSFHYDFVNKNCRYGTIVFLITPMFLLQQLGQSADSSIMITCTYILGNKVSCLSWITNNRILDRQQLAPLIVALNIQVVGLG